MVVDKVEAQLRILGASISSNNGKHCAVMHNYDHVVKAYYGPCSCGDKAWYTLSEVCSMLRNHAPQQIKRAFKYWYVTTTEVTQ